MCRKNFSTHAPIWLTLIAATLVLAADTFIPNNQPFGYQAPVALSKNDVKDGTAVAFVPWFEAGNFTGELLAAPVSSDGIVDHFSPIWRASETVDAKHWDLDRRIVTRNNASGVGVAFRYANLSPDQQGALISEALTNYIRGDRSGESATGFRERTRLLGDIIHSNPVYVGKPRRGYLFSNYLQYAVANLNRPGRVYVGANDGMLHAFSAETGNEEFAYIPSMLIPRLPGQAQTPFVHDYMVDGPLVAEDAYFGGAWHSVLVGGLGAGGKGLFALDVTSANIGSEVEAAARLLWEFTNNDTDRLGYTFSRPSIVRLNNGSWAAVIGNGYMSSNGEAALLLIDISNGSLIREIIVADNNNNGLSSPAVIDIDGDFIADIAYAGDLNGNLWKFDLSDPNPSNWAPVWDSKPLFMTEHDVGTGLRQPITTAPTVGRHPEGGYFVYVGTGRLLNEQDALDNHALAPQSFYGIWDNSPDLFDVPYAPVDLLQQSLLIKTHPEDSEPVRTATANIPDWTVHRGWSTRLDAGGAVPGTRVITDHTFRNGRMHFTSIDPTTGSGSNYLMQLNAYTGGAPSSTVIDVNGNGSIEITDNTDGDGNGTVENTAADRVVGQYLSFGTASAPVVAALGGSDAAIVNKLYTVLASDNPGVDPPDPLDPGLKGGHIDVDTSHEIYDLVACDGRACLGTTDHHVHEWDDKYDATVIDFFKIAGDGFNDIDEKFTDPWLGRKTFIITVANAHLSPGAVIEINGAAQPVAEYRAKIKRYLAGNLGPAETFPRYKLHKPTVAESLSGVFKLTDFKLSFARDSLLAGTVHPTRTGCVRSNQPGQAGEYRNGALTIQVLDATSVVGGYEFNPLNSAYETVSHAIHELGYAVSRSGTNDGSLFWETTAFWHWKGPCFGIDEADSYNTQYALEVGDVPLGTDDDIGGDPLPEPDPEPEVPPEAEATPPSGSVSTTVIAGGESGRLSWRELIIDE